MLIENSFFDYAAISADAVRTFFRFVFSGESELDMSEEFFIEEFIFPGFPGIGNEFDNNIGNIVDLVA